jgi:UDP-GlcNAc3NAcA epimerase
MSDVACSSRTFLKALPTLTEYPHDLLSGRHGIVTEEKQGRHRMTDLMIVVGARPQFIKTAPVIKEISSRNIDLTVVHSGQHYDPEMSAIFFRELHIPKPSVNLQSGSGSHARQTATIMQRLEAAILAHSPKIVVVAGDTNTTLAAAIAGAKLNVPVAHIEAGLRSYDLSMPEEINRRLTDHCSVLLFAPTKTAMRNLKNEGLQRRAYLTGDTMVDSLRMVMPALRSQEAALLKRFELQAREYVLVTLHRPSNVDDFERLHEIHNALKQVAKRIRVLFLVHPRTRGRLRKIKGLAHNREFTLAPPQGYIENLTLMKNASCILTDSGGMQKESFILHVPCITLRANTEWPETLQGGANRLINPPGRLSREILRVAVNEDLRTRITSLKNPFGDGRASSRIVRLLESSLQHLK